jgi:hypothetical protein
MRGSNRIILTILVASLVLSFLAGSAQATDSKEDTFSVKVSITAADYLDLDGDQIEDDILTEFSVSVPVASWKSSISIVYCLLELPSGQAFRCNILVIGCYSLLSLTVGWYNTAYEPGWYTFCVAACIVGNDVPEPGYDMIEFDPPTEGEPGSPVISIMEISVIC